MKETSRVRIHRFRDSVAISLDGETHYLSSEQASDISRMLEVYAKDIENRKFTNSKLVSWESEPISKESLKNGER